MAIWAFAPSEGNVHMAIYPDGIAEFQSILERGYVILDGQPADLVDPDDPNVCSAPTATDAGFMRFRFREPFTGRRLWLLEAAA